MKYLSGIYALNLPCSLDTCGDWHSSAINWSSVPFNDSDNSVFKDYGIEKNREIWNHDGHVNVANHIRALLDLIAAGQFNLAQGMRDDFICNDKYTSEIFKQVMLLKNSSLWQDIDRFMGSEYFSQWLRFKRNFYERSKHKDA